MPLVTNSGFKPVPSHDYIELRDDDDAARLLVEDNLFVDINNTIDVAPLAQHIDQISIIRIPFPSSADGRGFSLARQLRQMGYRGTLRASGHLISDQYRYALECGFTDVEIDPELAERQPVEHWQADSAPNYRDRLFTRNPPPEQLPLPDGVFDTTVLSVHHYSNTLFSFEVTRPQSLRFTAGEFVMIGLPTAGKPLYRAYSIATPSWDDRIGFYSIKVPNGEFTSQLQWLAPGDPLWIRKKATGSLVLSALNPGRRLFMVSTGTGFAPFASIIFDPEFYTRFDELVVTQTGRYQHDLVFAHQVYQKALRDPLVGEQAQQQLRLFTSTTRESSDNEGRITQLIEDGSFFDTLGIDTFDPRHDRVMICGSMDMLKDVRQLCDQRGFAPGSLSRPGDYVWERAFVD